MSQRGFARVCGVPQPNVSNIEAGVAGATVARLNRLLAPVDAQVAVVPSSAPTVAEWAELIGAALADGDEAAARVVFVRLADRLAGVEPAVRVALCVGVPPSTGDARFDAALAATVEFLLGRTGLPVPSWTASTPAAPEALFLVANPAVRDLVVAETPAVLRAKNVFVPPDFFESV